MENIVVEIYYTSIRFMKGFKITYKLKINITNVHKIENGVSTE